MIKKNEQQLRFLYGDTVVDVMREGVKSLIKSNKCKTISFDNLDKELEKLSKKKK